MTRPSIVISLISLPVAFPRQRPSLSLSAHRSDYPSFHLPSPHPLLPPRLSHCHAALTDLVPIWAEDILVFLMRVLLLEILPSSGNASTFRVLRGKQAGREGRGSDPQHLIFVGLLGRMLSCDQIVAKTEREDAGMARRM